MSLPSNVTGAITMWTIGSRGCCEMGTWWRSAGTRWWWATSSRWKTISLWRSVFFLLFNLRLYSTRRCLCFALAITPNASEMYMQRKLFYLYSAWTFNQNDVHLGSCFMIISTHFQNLFFLGVKTIFEMFPTHNLSHCLPQCNGNKTGEI